MWFISEPRSNSPPWDCQQCSRSEVISPRVAMGIAVPRPPLVSSLLIKVTDILGREGPLQSEGTLQAMVPLWSRKQTGMTPRVCLRAGETGWPTAGWGRGPRASGDQTGAGGGRSRRGLPPQLTPGGVPAPPHPLSCRRHPSCCTTDPRWTCCEHSGDGTQAPEGTCQAGPRHSGAAPGAVWTGPRTESIYHFCMRENRT